MRPSASTASAQRRQISVRPPAVQLRAAEAKLWPMESCVNAMGSIPQRRIMRPMSLLRTSSRERNNAIGNLLRVVRYDQPTGLARPCAGSKNGSIGLLQTMGDRAEGRRSEEHTYERK